MFQDENTQPAHSQHQSYGSMNNGSPSPYFQSTPTDSAQTNMGNRDHVTAAVNKMNGFDHMTSGLANKPSELDRLLGRHDDVVCDADRTTLLAKCATYNENIFGDVISVHNLNYEIRKKKHRLKILDYISAVFKPGTNAVLGPTGSGKTTLLDILAGRKNMSDITGQILVNGSPQPDQYSRYVGYVLQNDEVVMGTLTVRENITFSANLRLSSSLSKTEKDNRVQDIIDELGLGTCAESLVGTSILRGISGGERKRTNIGMELIISPNVLFLDEPTTGLDASTANAVMSVLRRLADKGNTIVFAVHQPRRSMYAMFDRLTLLAQGRTVYHGPATEALDFFASTGRHCDDGENPLDFFLDHINIDSSAVRRMEQTAATESNLRGIKAECSLRNKQTSWEGKAISTSEELAQEYRNSVWYKRFGICQNELQSILFAIQSHQQFRAVQLWNCPPNNVVEVNTLDTFKGKLDKFFSGYTGLFGIETLYAACLGFIIGIIFFQLKQTYPSGIQNRVGMLYAVVCESGFFAVPFFAVISERLLIVIHERASGYYRASSAILTTVFVEIILMQFLPMNPLIFLVYFMSGLQLNVTKFFIFYLAMAFETFTACALALLIGLSFKSYRVAVFLLNVVLGANVLNVTKFAIFYLTIVTETFTASALALLIGTSFKSYRVAIFLINVVLVMILLFSGLTVNIATLPAWISWLQYFSFMRYALNILSINELKDLEFFVYNGTSIIEALPFAGNEYLLSQGIPYETSWNFWSNTAGLTILGLIMYLFSYVQLLRLKTRQ